jgi:hypothetical protein
MFPSIYDKGHYHIYVADAQQSAALGRYKMAAQREGVLVSSTRPRASSGLPRGLRSLRDPARLATPAPVISVPHLVDMKEPDDWFVHRPALTDQAAFRALPMVPVFAA